MLIFNNQHLDEHEWSYQVIRELKSQEALKACEIALADQPDSIVALYRQGRALNALGEEKSAATNCYDKVLKQTAQLPIEWTHRGHTFHELNKYEEALECYECALRMNHDQVRAWYGKGLALSELGQNEEAIECYDQALRIDPQDAFAWSRKVIILNNLGKKQEVIECYDEMLRIDPKDVFVWNNKANALSNLGQNQEAIECYDEMLRINPEDVGAWRAKGLIYHLDFGRFEEAMNCYIEVSKIDPNNANSWCDRSAILFYHKQYEKAIEFADRALEIYQNHREALWNKGASLKNLGRFEEGLPYIKESARLGLSLAIEALKEWNITY